MFSKLYSLTIYVTDTESIHQKTRNCQIFFGLLHLYQRTFPCFLFVKSQLLILHFSLTYIIAVITCFCYVLIRDRTYLSIVRTRTNPTFWPFFVRTYLPTPTYLFSLSNINFIEKLPKIKNL